MIHIITINWTSDKWIDIQSSSFKKYITSPYKVYTKLGNMGEDLYEKHKDKYYYCAKGEEGEISHVTTGMKLAINKIKENYSPEDIILIIDSDAFLIDNLDKLSKHLQNFNFVSCQEPEHERDPNRLIPHPMFFMFKGKMLDEKLEYFLTHVKDDGTGTWWGGLINWMVLNKHEYYPVKRSNKINLHPLYFGLYENILYHHWAGSRKMITRPDRRLHAQTKEPLNSIAERNHLLSNKVYDQIVNQKDLFIEYLKGEYNNTEYENKFNTTR